MPVMVMHVAATNTAFPEYWAMLAILVAFFVLVRGHFVASAVAGLIAVLFRETFGAWLLALVVVALLGSIADKRWRRYALFSAGMLGAGIVGYLLHAAAGAAYIIKPTEGSSLAGYLLNSASRSITFRLLAPLSYLMAPFGWFVFSPVALVPLGLVGLWVGLARTNVSRLVSVMYVLAYLIYFATLGAPSTYWGQVVMPLVVVGLALFLASLDRLGKAASWRFALPDALAATEDGTLPAARKRSDRVRHAHA
jgi:hypothetical protein